MLLAQDRYTFFKQNDECGIMTNMVHNVFPILFI